MLELKGLVLLQLTVVVVVVGNSLNSVQEFLHYFQLALRFEIRESLSVVVESVMNSDVTTPSIALLGWFTDSARRR